MDSLRIQFDSYFHPNHSSSYNVGLSDVVFLAIPSSSDICSSFADTDDWNVRDDFSKLFAGSQVRGRLGYYCIMAEQFPCLARHYSGGVYYLPTWDHQGNV